MISYEFKQLLISLKYSFLKYLGWVDAFHYCNHNDRDMFDCYIYGKKIKNCKIKKYSESELPASLGLYPWYVEKPDGCRFNIINPDRVLILPWSETKEGKQYIKKFRRKNDKL